MALPPVRDGDRSSGSGALNILAETAGAARRSAQKALRVTAGAAAQAGEVFTQLGAAIASAGLTPRRGGEAAPEGAARAAGAGGTGTMGESVVVRVLSRLPLGAGSLRGSADSIMTDLSGSRGSSGGGGGGGGLFIREGYFDDPKPSLEREMNGPTFWETLAAHPGLARLIIPENLKERRPFGYPSLSEVRKRLEGKRASLDEDSVCVSAGGGEGEVVDGPQVEVDYDLEDLINGIFLKTYLHPVFMRFLTYGVAFGYGVSLDDIRAVAPPLAERIAERIQQLRLDTPDQIKARATWLRNHVPMRDMVAAIRDSPHLRHLRLGECATITDIIRGAIQTTRALGYLNLSAGVSDPAVQICCGNLQEIDLSGLTTLVGDEGDDQLIAFLSHCPNVTHLHLDGTGISDRAIEKGVSQLKKLTMLSLKGCRGLTGAALAALPPSITHLDLSHHRWSDDDLVTLNRHRSLRCLDLSHNSALRGTVFHEWGHLQLDALNLEGCGELCTLSLISDVLPYANLYNGIRHLNVSGCIQLRDAALRFLGCMENLTHFKLNGCKQLTGMVLHNLRRLEKLTHLEIAEGSWTNQDIAYLAEVRALKELRMRHSLGITGEGMRALNPNRLTLLDIRECSGIHPGDLEGIPFERILF